jgi:hypothetical protein
MDRYLARVVTNAAMAKLNPRHIEQPEDHNVETRYTVFSVTTGEVFGRDLLWDDALNVGSDKCLYVDTEAPTELADMIALKVRRDIRFATGDGYEQLCKSRGTA